MNLRMKVFDHKKQVAIVSFALVLAMLTALVWNAISADAKSRVEYDSKRLWKNDANNYMWVNIVNPDGTTSKMKITVSYSGDATATNFVNGARTLNITSAISGTNNHNLRCITTSKATIQGDTGYYDRLEYDISFTLPAHMKYGSYERDYADGSRFGSDAATVCTHGTSARTVTVRMTVNIYNLGITTYNNGDEHLRFYNTSYTLNLKNDSYTVTYNPNGGEVSTTSKRFVDGVANTSPTPTRDGYNFNGWYTSASGGTQLPASATFCASNATWNKSMTVYAHWTLKAYTVKYIANGGTGTMADQTISSGEEEELSECNFRKSGYFFAGWSDSASGQVKYQDGATVRDLAGNGGTITLYAIWSKAGNFNLQNVIEDDDMFYGCTNIQGGDGTKYRLNYVDSSYAHIDDAESDPGYFTGK